MIKYSKLLLIILFIMGIGMGVGLLSYSGKELVNVMVFLGFAIFLPLIFSLLSLLSFIYNLFKKDDLLWQGLKSSNQIGFVFSLGLLSAFLMTIVTQDIAFGWSTTLEVSSQALFDFLDFFAIWKSFLPSALPSVDLIELSEFNRLGGVIDKAQIDSAKVLGSWWKYLALMIFVWGVVPRFLLYQASRYFLKNNTLEFSSKNLEEEFVPLSNEYKNRINLSKIDIKKYQMLSWTIDDITSSMIGDTFSIKSSKIYTFALTKDIEDDDKKLKLLKDIDSIVVVKSWEIPTMDFIDFIDDVKEIVKSSKIYLLCIGLEKEGFIAHDKDVNIWLRKLKETNHENIIALN